MSRTIASSRSVMFTVLNRTIALREGTRCWLGPGILSLSCLGSVACDGTPTELKRVDAGVHALAAFAPALANAGCAIGTEAGLGSARLVVLDRAQLPVHLPSFDAATGIGRSKNALRVLRIPVQRTDGSQVVFACLAPYDDTFESLLRTALKRAGDGGSWAQASRLLDNAPAVRIEKDLLTDVGAFFGRHLFPNAAAMVPPVYLPNVHWASDTGKKAVLPPITTYASSPTWVLDSWEFMLTARRGRSFSELISWDFFGGPDCAGASDFWFAAEEEIEALEHEGELIHAGQNLLAPKQCEFVVGADICVDFYIRNRRSFVFGGNDREETPWAGISDSKVHLYLATGSNHWEVKINHTRIRIGSAEILPVDDSARLFRPDSDVVITRFSNGDIEVGYSFKNNYCPSRSACISIDGSILFKYDPTKPGGYDVYWDRDAYPTMAVYKRVGTQWQLIAFDPEHSDGGWTAWLALIENARRSRRLPEPCALQ